MTRFIVQFCMPVDNPENNVRMSWVDEAEKSCLFFEVPINSPNAHMLGLAELLSLAGANKDNRRVLHTHKNRDLPLKGNSSKLEP